MKDKFLKQKLDNYVTSIALDENVLKSAYFVMEQKRANGDYQKNIQKKRTPIFLRFAAAAAVIIVALSIILNNLPKLEDAAILTYSLDSLTQQTVNRNDLYNDDALVLSGEEGQYEGKYFVYKNSDGEIYVIVAIYKTIRDSNVDEVILITDFYGGLTDYRQYKPSDEVPTVRNFDNYENGEYYSYLSKLNETLIYYIFITSPSANAGEYYENLLLSDKTGV